MDRARGHWKLTRRMTLDLRVDSTGGLGGKWRRVRFVKNGEPVSGGSLLYRLLKLPVISEGRREGSL